MRYKVFIDDNFHYQDESERYLLGKYRSFQAAVEACEKVVDDYLDSAYQDGMDAAALLSSYVMFGEDPFIVPKAQGVEFSARDYARRRCDEICTACADDRTPSRSRRSEMSKYEAMRTNPDNWKLGLAYVCAEDPRIIVRQRLPVGWAWNFAHARVYPAILAAVLVLLGPLYLAWLLYVRSGLAFGLVALAALCVIMLIAHRLSRDPE